MCYVIKTCPLEINQGEPVTITGRHMYDGKNIRAGDRVFVWFSETQGGNGLAARGIAQSVQLTNNGQSIDVRLMIEQRYRGQPLGNTELELYRNGDISHPLAELAKKLLIHAHNKIAFIEEHAANFLEERFVTAS